MAPYIWDVTDENEDRIAEFMSDKLKIDVNVMAVRHYYNKAADTTGETDSIRVTYSIMHDEHHIWFTAMPGQCGVLIAHYLDFPDIEVEVVEMMARILCYRTVLVSHVYNHSALHKYTDKGFESIWNCHNLHSGRTIEILACDVGDPHEDERELIDEIFQDGDGHPMIISYE